MVTKLTNDMLEEFDTPILQSFAKAYLAFMYSSPCTAKRKLYKYFEPLKTEELSEYCILYGQDREKTYEALIAEFKACIMVKAFDKFFDDPKKTKYWQSKSIPKLIILKKWLTE